MNLVGEKYGNLEGKQCKKSYSVKKFGLLPAFKMAVVERNRQIDLLNSQGAGYSSTHGKQKGITT